MMPGLMITVHILSAWVFVQMGFLILHLSVFSFHGVYGLSYPITYGVAGQLM